MIPANELRIGNWVNIHDKPADTYHPQKITAIYSSNSVEMADSSFGIDFPFDANSLYPIPLTPELLLSNGFEEDFESSEYKVTSQDSRCFVSDYHSILIDEKGIASIWGHGFYDYIRDLPSLHLLQNYHFFNYGTELEINL